MCFQLEPEYTYSLFCAFADARVKNKIKKYILTVCLFLAYILQGNGIAMEINSVPLLQHSKSIQEAYLGPSC